MLLEFIFGVFIWCYLSFYVNIFADKIFFLFAVLAILF